MVKVFASGISEMFHFKSCGKIQGKFLYDDSSECVHIRVSLPIFKNSFPHQHKRVLFEGIVQVLN